MNTATRYYAVDCNGKIHVESSSKAKVEAILKYLYSADEIEDMEIEIIEGK
ncbi:MAG: hypothetical protein J6S85_19390 [Methanobrevibacter sp.]|nr:hypothetical protein [Methanobrevibacter sp.]